MLLQGACALTQIQTHKLDTAISTVKTVQYQVRKAVQSNAGLRQVEGIANVKAATLVVYLLKA